MTPERSQPLDYGVPSGTLPGVTRAIPHRLSSAWEVPVTAPRARRAGGVALLTVMLVLSMAAVAAVAMAAREQIAIRRTGNLLGAEQAYRYALGVEGRFIGLLDSERDAQGVDGPASAWAKPFGPADLGEARIEGRVEDLQGRFNVNNLLSDGQPSALDVERFDRLLKVLNLPRELRQALLDWLDPDDEPRFPGGAEDEAYLRATPARRAANGPMVSTSELRLIAGMGAEEYERLEPNVVALPERTAVNLNTAPAAVLMALFKDLGEDDAGAFAEARLKEPFVRVDEALVHQALAGLEANPAGLAVGSRWFRVHARAESGSGRAELLSVVSRPETGVPSVWMRERGAR
jgi:general secretion pathway protein K